MSIATAPVPILSSAETIAELLEQFGGIPPERVRLRPRPGAATEEDLVEAEARTGRICELIDGVLVEKAKGTYESAVAAALIYFLKEFLQDHRLGVVLGEAGLLRIMPRQVRAPDVAFLSFERLGTRRLPDQPILPAAPDLAVEVLSPGNTPAEMDRKLREYFAAGVRLVWYIDPRTRAARCYTAPELFQEIGEDGVLTGNTVLPGFQLALRRLFAEAEGAD
jgi:Uma2 family endonuclease